MTDAELLLAIFLSIIHACRGRGDIGNGLGISIAFAEGFEANKGGGSNFHIGIPNSFGMRR